MIRGLYTAATGMIAQRNHMNAIINNATNVETAGYKGDGVVSRSFADRLIDRINDPSILNRQYNVGSLNGGTRIDELITSFTQGSLDATGQQTDLALSGDGFFCVQTPDGERYTRAGNFNVDDQGYLCNADGYRVLGTNGNQLQVGFGEFSVSEEGIVRTSEGQLVGTLRVVQFPDNNGLRKQGDNLFYNYANMNAVQATDCVVKQNYLEMSNVNTADVMVDMMTVYRVYESNQKIMQMTDESLGLAVNQIGKI